MRTERSSVEIDKKVTENQRLVEQHSERERGER